MHTELLAEGMALGITTPGTQRQSPDAARRRLLRYGADSLSDLELLSVVSGLNDDAVLQDLLLSGLKGVFQEAPEVLEERVGAQGASRLLAALALTRRLLIRRDERPRLKTPEAIFQFMQPHFLGLRHEELHVLCFNSRTQLIKHVRVSEGTVDQCHVDPREVLAPAITSRASALVLVHNHPAGDAEPSTWDVALTRQLCAGAQLLCVRLLDHLVLCDQSYVSMRERGLFTPERATSVPRVSEGNDSLTVTGRV